MTLEQKLLLRLREWQRDARQIQNVLHELHEQDEARWMLEAELMRLEQCISGLSLDLTPPHDVFPGGFSARRSAQ